MAKVFIQKAIVNGSVIREYNGKFVSTVFASEIVDGYRKITENGKTTYENTTEYHPIQFAVWTGSKKGAEIYCKGRMLYGLELNMDAKAEKDSEGKTVRIFNNFTLVDRSLGGIAQSVKNASSATHAA